MLRRYASCVRINEWRRVRSNPMYPAILTVELIWKEVGPGSEDFVAKLADRRQSNIASLPSGAGSEAATKSGE